MAARVVKFAHPFAVSTSGGNIAVRAGRHYWYDTVLEDYTITTLDSTAGAWASVAVPTAGTSKYVYFTRAHDSGAVTTATVTKGISTSEATVTALANDYTRVWIVAVLTADADGVVTIEQRLTQDVEDGPDIRESGVYVWKNSTTAPRGYVLADGNNGTVDMGGYFMVGYKSGHADYGAAGATGGNAKHGGGINDHLPHKVNHSHPTCVTTTTTDVISYCLAFCMPRASVLASVDVKLNCMCDDLLDPTVWWCREYDDPPDTSQIEDGADHDADSGENVAWHSETDNRPPYRVGAWYMKL